MQNLILQHVCAQGIPAPMPTATLTGSHTAFAKLPLVDGHKTAPHAVRMLTYLPGTLLSEAPRVHFACNITVMILLNIYQSQLYVSSEDPPFFCSSLVALIELEVFRAQSLQLFRNVGALLGRVDTALGSFRPQPDAAAAPPALWDLRSAAATIGQLLPRHTDAKER